MKISFIACFIVLTFFAMKTSAAVNDYVCAYVNEPVEIDVLQNDALGGLCIGNLDITVPKHGTATFLNGSVRYSSDATYGGIDSLRYTVVDCNGNRVDSAMVYILVNKPLAISYIACQGVTMKLGFSRLTGVRYDWYTVATGGSIISGGSNVNDIDVKINKSTITYWVEPTYNRTKFPRIRVDFELSDDCGKSTALTGCYVTGTLLFKEDFGGNAVSDPKCKSNGIPQVQGYKYDVTLNGQGTYAICKQNNQTHNTWYVFKDHTYRGDEKRGYLIAFDATKSSGQFYEHRVDNLCAGTKLYFSAWLASLINNEKHLHKANLIFNIEDPAGNRLVQYSTGNIPDKHPYWKLYGFQFTIPDGVSSVILKIMNNGTGSDGNDFVMDDIEIRLCAPQIGSIIFPADTNVCSGTSLSFSGKYVDDGAFGLPLNARWEYSATGDLEGAWTTISPTVSSNNDTIIAPYTLSGITAAQAGYYRMAVSAQQYIDHANCRAMTPPMKLNVTPLYIPSDVRLCVLPAPNMTISLSSYIDTLNDQYSINWKTASPSAPGISDAVKGTFDASKLVFPDTHIYLYETSSLCGVREAKAYVHAIREYNNSEIMSVCKDLLPNGSLNLNQLLGLEISGGQLISTGDVDKVFKNNLKWITQGRHAGAIIFDTQTAYAQATNSAYSYNGDSSRKQFRFEYSKGNIKKQITLVIDRL
ncbi:MAG: hypothetical protein LBG92_11765 [Prevotellaceae bacterium]|jgi:hypothetical protein|nr:hypothetical protein [Prevotellaceae bacterium]